MVARRALPWAAAAIWLLALTRMALAAENLSLAPDLSFTDDSSNSFPIQGDSLGDAEFGKGRAAVVFFGASHCWNTNREAERLVALYPKFRDRVSFIVVDVNHPSEAQRPLLKAHYQGYIPTLVVFAPDGTVLYARSGETADARGDSSALDALLSRATNG
jgi:hypothetical protein